METRLKIAFGAIVAGCAVATLAQPTDPAPAGDSAAPAVRPVTPTSQPAEQLAAAEENWDELAAQQGSVPQNYGKVSSSSNTASRGDADPDLLLAAVANVSVDRTMQPSPRLYWHLSKSTDLPVIVSILRPDQPRPVARIRIAGPHAAGFHAVDSAAMGVSLEPGTTYDWVVAIVQDERYRSKDLVVGGAVARAPIEPSLLARLNAASPLDRVQLLEQAGFDVDAFDQAMAAIKSNPTHPKAQAYRAQILQQLELTEVSPTEIRGR